MPTQLACHSDQPVYLMFKIVAVSFENFNKIYHKLAINKPLPHSCQALIDLKHVSHAQYVGKDVLPDEHRIEKLAVSCRRVMAVAASAGRPWSRLPSDRRVQPAQVQRRAVVAYRRCYALCHTRARNHDLISE